VAPPDEDIVFGRVSVRLGSTIVGELPLHLGPLVIGRTPDNDLQIDNRFVSRHHCRILTTRENSVLEDLGSTNGIRMLGKRVKRRRLRDGDTISLGHYDIVYWDERPNRHTETATGIEFEDEGQTGAIDMRPRAGSTPDEA
jgi:pSer/pThr/pTyr-binding forkhead associated (FHA) protein